MPMRQGRLRLIMLAAAAAAVALGGCARKSAPLATAPLATAPLAAAPARALAAQDEPYTLDAGDRLRVLVFGQDGLSNSYAVDAGGAITMPLIGAVPARALTAAELARAIAARLRQGYIREPHVAVEIEAYRPFFILGEVTNPGQYPYVPHMTVENAVAIAGGFTPRAQRRTVALTRPLAGAPLRAEVPLAHPVRPGDTILVRERWF